MRTSNVFHNVVLIALILPIAFVANILRVLALILATYYFGDSAGQAFHDYAGYAEIVFAFGSFFLLDALLSRLMRESRTSVPATPIRS
jgi:exosortase/archaeosortase family protein